MKLRVTFDIEAPYDVVNDRELEQKMARGLMVRVDEWLAYCADLFGGKIVRHNARFTRLATDDERELYVPGRH
ncbi:MAG TPA: hypothetical protein VMS04_15700 [Vicinamibacterales bacterium]|jgi:hypothetical protein|nr:hypothetical protein [Vicinamibacterales bacterium]